MRIDCRGWEPVANTRCRVTTGMGEKPMRIECRGWDLLGLPLWWPVTNGMGEKPMRIECRARDLDGLLLWCPLTNGMGEKPMRIECRGWDLLGLRSHGPGPGRVWPADGDRRVGAEILPRQQQWCPPRAGIPFPLECC